MLGVVQAIRGLFTPSLVSENISDEVKTSPIVPSQPLELIHQHLDKTISDAVILEETFAVNGTELCVEVRADKMLVKDETTYKSKVVRIDQDSLDHYHALDIELRLQLGQRIAQLVPELAHAKHEVLLNHTANLLETIAKDNMEKVRVMLAQELAEMPDAPQSVIQQLMHDESAKVVCPILEFSPLLSDQELIEIIESSGMPGVSEAVAKRKTVSAEVSQAIVETQQPDAIGALLNNSGADINEHSMNVIVEMAPSHEQWHVSLASRPELTEKTMARIKGFIAQDILMGLEDEGQLKAKPKKHTRIAVQHRMNSWTESQMREAELLARKMQQAGTLDSETIDTAIHKPDEPFVIASLAIKAMMSREKVKKILRADSPRAITALAWEAGLSMRSAYAMQQKIGHIHHTKLVHPRGGEHFPLREDEMQTYLDLFS